MVHYLVIQKNGDIVEKQTRGDVDVNGIYKLCGYKSSSNFENLHNFSKTIDNIVVNYKVYGKREGRANSENKYDFPPPIDTTLFFGNICLFKTEHDEYVDLAIEEWDAEYEKMFGGFHDIGDSDEERSEDSEVYSDDEYTKEGYHKDSFVIDDEELSEEEYL